MSGAGSRNEATIQASYAIAHESLDRIRQNRLAAVPPNFRFWYCHLSGSHHELSKALNEIIDRGAPVTQDEIDELGERFLQQDWKRFDQLSCDIQQQLGGVVDALSKGLETSTEFSTYLAATAGSLMTSPDTGALRRVVSALATATLRAGRDSHSLSRRLNDSMDEIVRLKQGLEAIRAESRSDALTGLSNRKAFDETIGVLIEEASRRQEPLALIMLDVDHFKSFNDNYGHLSGDQVLKLVAQGLLQSENAGAIAARYGGEEFAMLLPRVALPRAIKIAEGVRCAVMAKELKKRSTGERLGRITVSLGVAALRPGDHHEMLIERADACLYAAKRNGRNRVFSELDSDQDTLANAS